jgi:hypothetical protein
VCFHIIYWSAILILQYQTQNIGILQYYANAINIIGDCQNMIAMILFGPLTALLSPLRSRRKNLRPQVALRAASGHIPKSSRGSVREDGSPFILGSSQNVLLHSEFIGIRLSSRTLLFALFTNNLIIRIINDLVLHSSCLLLRCAVTDHHSG